MSISNDKIKQLQKIMENTPYLIKFQGENLNYAKSLMDDGELHMCSAQYYIDEELISGIRGQGDKYENEILDFIRVDMECPMYCMYAVRKEQCKDNEIWIDKRVINDFCSSGGYITICKTSSFIERFNSVYSKGFDAGLITYGNRSVAFDIKLLKEQRSGHFFKKQDLNYQQEFRIVLDEKLKQRELPEDKRWLIAKDGTKYWRVYEYEPLNLKIGDITEFSIQLPIELETYENVYKIKIEDLDN